MTFNEIQSFASWYRGTVDFAAAHLASLLAQALAFRQGLGPGQLQWIETKISEFAKEKTSQEIVQGWLALAISDPVEAPNLPGFDELLSQVVNRIARMGVPHYEAAHKLKLTMALMGEEKLKLVRLVPRAALTLQELLIKSSCTQAEAASALDCSPRTIRTWASDGKLTKTAGGRIVCDDKLIALGRLRHSPAKN
ncbi:hypothetical protein MYX77_04020 [Acidobacteriia bacterium AH_259_A11_L15]|nr:hypothetical protein [Acidobacteriia bacterium AH_259_A11_L15]